MNRDFVSNEKTNISHPLKNGRWVNIIAEIKDNETGEIIQCQDETPIYDNEKHPDYFIWEEGNYSCDCNRGLFLYRAKGIDKDFECGMERFSVNLKNAKDGKVYYREFK